ncbi:MFS transporter [Mycetocola tolaasinivorans]|uniref:MFS transporter n=1 Tax=Mycetocola tolaasinivorans TaxID=76635 RepID=A0A3L6ZY87_9MICO|nr:MFS transporter [Mycetocola tolaasinivorans]RLP72678.1 MFS transporter [Mycetocola tolaasinivorans]
MSSSPLTHSPAQLRAWRNALFVVFLLSGLSIASMASRIPALRESLEINNGTLGLVLFGMSAGSILGLASSNIIRERLGVRVGMRTALLISMVGLAIMGVGSTIALPVVVIGLAIFGFGNGVVDVMMNLDGALAEAELGKTVMPMMHAFFSVGTVLGALLGSMAAFAHIPLSVHVIVMAVLIAIAAIVVVRWIPTRPIERHTRERVPFGERMRANAQVWRDRRLLLIGLIMLGMSLAEGSAGDWIAQAVVDGYDQLPGTGALVYAIFVSTLTLTRFVGGPFIDRFGRVQAIRLSASLAVIGLALFIFAPAFPLALVGAAAWGAGCALGFPVGMSAAAEHPTQSAARVSAVAMMGYVAFLAGPPAIGLLGEHVGLLNALLPILGLVIIALIAAPAAKPTGQGTSTID